MRLLQHALLARVRPEPLVLSVQRAGRDGPTKQPAVRTRGDESPFVVLWCAFFAQFFNSESVTSDIQLRQTMIWVLTFLFLPGLWLLVLLFPAYQSVVIRVSALRAPPGLIDDMLEWIVFLFTTYSMVTVGLMAVCAWDALTFDRRDAMVLGPLPLRGATIIVAKLTALGVFLLAASTAVNLLNAIVFAFETTDRLGSVALVKHFVAFLAATVGAAAFGFAVIVMIRGTVELLGGARFAAAAGSLLQFLFVIALLCLVILSPAVWEVPFVTASTTDWMPTAWFVGLFERLRGSPRFSDPEFVTLARRAFFATPMAVAGAVVVSVVGFRRQMQFALAPSASTGRLGAARISRTLARWIVGGDAVARATSDFILLTIARSRAQQAPIAINVAIGAAIVVAALSGSTNDLASLMRPRTTVLWIPLVLAYWTTIGLRASFFVPSELPASWLFRSNAPELTPAYWSGTRAAMMAFVVPPTLMIALLLVPLLGWWVAAWHALVACALVILLVEVVALTINHIPFTRAYQPGHAKLRTRWPIYLLGMYAFAYWPARLEQRVLESPALLLKIVACLVAGIAVLEVVGRRTAYKWSASSREEGTDDPWEATTLDIARIVEGAHVGR